MSFQVTLRAARVNRGMKQADAARSIGVSSARSIIGRSASDFPRRTSCFPSAIFTASPWTIFLYPESKI